MEKIKDNKIISVPQLIVMLIMNRLVISITFSSSSINGCNIWDCLISSLVVFALSFLIVIPMYILCNDRNGTDILDINRQIFGKIGHIITVIYSIYFLLVCAHTLSIFKVFIENVMNPPISFLVLSTSMIVLACYAASKGIESIARSSVIILFFTSVLLILMGISLFKLIDYTNFKPFFYDGYDAFKNGIIYMISRMSCIPALGLLLPMSTGNAKKGILIWNIAVIFLMSMFIFLVIGILGDLSQVKLFPIYTSTSVAKISKFENLDALFLGLWTSGIFIKLSMFLNLSSECLRKMFGKNSNKIIIFFLGIILIASNFFSKITNIYSGIFNTSVLLIFTLSTSFLIPLIIIVARKFFKKRTLIE